MRETLLTNCERNFVNKCIEEETRLDGRNLLEARSVKIYFGSNWGCCMVSLGNTKAIAQVSCDIQQPKTSRPNEGMIHINVELSQLAAQNFESGRQSEAAIMISRQLEKCFKDSKCVDLESLCIVADKKVWNLRIDINVINHDGNLIDCASIATLAALLHFHRPDVTSTGEEVIIHPASEKDFLPLTLFHYPVCISFITFERELCSLHFDYLTKTMTVEDVISAVSYHAATYAAKLVQQIKETVTKDVQSRYKKDNSNICSFKESIHADKLTSMIGNHISIKLRKWDAVAITKDESMETENEGSRIIKHHEGSAELVPIFKNSPERESSVSSMDDSDCSNDEKCVKSRTPTKRTPTNIDEIYVEDSN
ncbi:exosome complex component RRP45 isoform X2 [Odontomachus brunneus]|uniref:exosome complex component RRP45 isoform X2 n=1 Tax=Odontomachus brunneus TaxID=486640 RepID=UPI0013F1BFA3|nr:exosome complex component RRP45 isoform X2 [Odontomachus brunneus]